MKAAEIRQLTDEELAKTIKEYRHELLNLRLQGQTGQLENTARVRVVRKDIARMRSEQTVRSKQQSN